MKIIDQEKLPGFLFGCVSIYIQVKFQSTCVVREVFVAESRLIHISIKHWRIEFPLMFWCRVYDNQKERLSVTSVTACIEKIFTEKMHKFVIFAVSINS